MTAPFEPPAEPPPAGQAPAVIPPTAEPKARRRRGGGAGRHFGPRPVDDPLDAWLPATRCTKAQRATADAEAEAEGISLNGLVRRRMFGSPGPRAHRNPSEHTKAVVQLAAQMGWRGSNLNQIARRFNIEDIPAPDELFAAIAEHRETCAEIRRILKLLCPDADHD